MFFQSVLPEDKVLKYYKPTAVCSCPDMLTPLSLCQPQHLCKKTVWQVTDDLSLLNLAKKPGRSDVSAVMGKMGTFLQLSSKLVKTSSNHRTIGSENQTSTLYCVL